MKKNMLATVGAAFATALPAFAQDSGYTVPAGVQSAIDDLGDASSALAGAVAPALSDIVLAFIGIAALLWVGRFLWRKAQGRS